VQDVPCSPDTLLASILLSEKNQPGLWIISGPRGSGKTFLCSAIAGQSRNLGYKVGGLLSPAVLKNGRKIGIDLVDLATTERRRMAIRRRSVDGGILVGSWSIDPNTIEWGNSVLHNLDGCELIILDELGPLEFKEDAGFQEGFHLLDSHGYQKALVVVRLEYLAIAQARWPNALVYNLEEGGGL